MGQPELQLSRRNWCSAVSAFTACLLPATGRSDEPSAPAVSVPPAADDIGFADTQILGDRVVRFPKWPAITFQSHQGKSVDLYRDVIAGRSIVLTFFYTRCDGSCPQTLSRMASLARIERDLMRPTRFVSISLDPARDTPSELRSYSQGLVPSGGDWHFLTGTIAGTNELRRFLGFYDLIEAPTAIARRHAAMVLFGSDLSGQWLTLPAMSSLRQWRSMLARCVRPAAD